MGYCWGDTNGKPFLFVDADGVGDSVRLFAQPDSSYLHARTSRTIGDAAESLREFRRALDDVIDREGSACALLRKMYAAGASARDVGLFSDHLSVSDNVAVAQRLAHIAIKGDEYGTSVEFSDWRTAQEDVVVFGDGIDDHGVSGVIIVRDIRDKVRVLFPGGERQFVPLGRRVLAALVETARIVNPESLDYIAVASPKTPNAIPEHLWSHIEIRIDDAVDIATTRRTVGPYRSLDPSFYPISIATGARIVVVRDADRAVIASYPIYDDLALPTFMLPNHVTYDDIEDCLLDSHSPSGGKFMFILSDDPNRREARSGLSISAQVKELADIFRREVTSLVEPTAKWTPRRARCRLKTESVYLHFPTALLSLSEWNVDRSVSLNDIETAFRRMGTQRLTLDCIDNQTWAIRYEHPDTSNTEMTMNIVDCD